MTRLLIIGAVWPEPNSSAAGGRMLQLIELFTGQDWQVTFATAAGDSAHAVDLSEFGVTTAAIELNNSSFDQFVSDLEPDVVLFDRFMTEEQFGWRVAEQCPNAVRILNSEDLHFLRQARQAKVKAGAMNAWGFDGLNSAEIQTTNAKREIASILRSDLSIIISQTEIDILQEQFTISRQLTHYTPFMLPQLSPDETWPSFAACQHFISIGNFRHAPNWDAVLQLKEVVWPLIRRRLSDAQLHIYGAYPPQKAMALHRPQERFYVNGWADDAHDVMKKARICLAPLRFGAGLKGKLISAMQAGTPSVTTPIGAEGMHGEMAWAGLVASEPQAFADAAVVLYQDEVAWRVAQANGAAIINQRYAAAEHVAALLKRIAELRANLEQERLANFTGAMLRHHTLQSTRYMARWIEAKNRPIS